MLKNYKLELAVFICGAVVMIYEMVGSRLLAPYFGTSLFVWTSIIGVILGSLSLGYFLGGKLADKKPSWEIFSFIIFLGAVLIAVTGFVETPLLIIIQQALPDLRLSSLLSSLLLFTPASVVLGMVSPYAIRLKMESVAESGRTAGTLYAVSTIGSIVGTFSAGFYLISYFGSSRIIFLLSAILTATSLIVFIGEKTKFLRGFFLLLFLSLSFFANLLQLEFEKNITADVDTNYNRVRIYDVEEDKSQRKVRYLTTGGLAVQSAMYVDAPFALASDYAQYYRLANYFNSNIGKALLIGGGAYSYPKFFLKEHPHAVMDVVEIDPELTELSEHYFALDTEDPRLNIYHQDGRMFLNQVEGKYDAVFMDAFGSSYSIPYQLATVEATRNIARILSPQGVSAVNVISALQGEKSKLLQAVYATYKEVFPQVLIFKVDAQLPAQEVQNVILYGFKTAKEIDLNSADGDYKQLLANLYTDPVSLTVPVLTDEYAPVDRYVLKMLK